MKRIIAVFLAVIVANYAMAHGSHGSNEDSSGLSAGLEFGLHIHTHDDDDDEGETEVAPNAAISLSYSEGFFDDKLEFDIGLSYIFNFKKGYFDLVHDYSPDEDSFQQVLCLNLGLSYSLDIKYFSTLSFILENDTDFYLSPRIDGGKNKEGELKPGIKWNWGLNFGDIYVRYDLPLKYVSYFGEELGVGSDISLGWQSKFGLGLDFIGHFLLSPESGFDGVDAIVSYALSVKNFTFYASCELEGIGSEEGICIVPIIGFRYSF